VKKGYQRLKGQCANGAATLSQTKHPQSVHLPSEYLGHALQISSRWLSLSIGFINKLYKKQLYHQRRQ
jgi:hypothetical protein